MVLQYEYFDTATAKEARWAAEKPPTTINVPSSHAGEWFFVLELDQRGHQRAEGGKRPSEQQNRERAEGSGKRPRLRS